MKFVIGRTSLCKSKPDIEFDMTMPDSGKANNVFNDVHRRIALEWNELSGPIILHSPDNLKVLLNNNDIVILFEKKKIEREIHRSRSNENSHLIPDKSIEIRLTAYNEPSKL